MTGVQTCALPIYFDISVNPSGQVNLKPDIQLCHGQTVPLIEFFTVNTGGTTTFNWTNNLTSIGLAAFGTGDIASFTAINTGSTPDTAMIIVTPTFSQQADCYEMTDTFLIIVDPIPVVNSSANITICSGDNVNYSLVSNVTGATYSWTSSEIGRASCRERV